MSESQPESSKMENGAVRPSFQSASLPADESTKEICQNHDNSDTEAGERPVREKLKETSIAGLPKHPVETTKQEEYKVEGDTMMNSQDTSASVVQATIEDDLAASNPRGRPTRKRSFEDLQAGEQSTDASEGDRNLNATDKTHKRMRSRDANSVQHASTNELPYSRGDAEVSDKLEPQMSTGAKASTPPPSNIIEPNDVVQNVLSPKKKRSRDQFDKDHEHKDEADITRERSKSGSEGAEDDDLARSGSLRETKGEPEKKRHRDLSQERNGALESEPATTKGNTSSGFGNTSVASPFGALASTKSAFVPSKTSPRGDEGSGRARTTSPSAFASSGLSAFAGSDKSPFGALGASSGSGFGSFGSAATGKPASTGFGGGLGSSTVTTSASPFVSSGSGFGGLGGSSSGGGSGGGFGSKSGGLSSFAASGGSGIIGATSGPAKAFGAPEEDEDVEEDEEGSGDSEQEQQDDKPKDKRFVEQEIETGEEGEETIFSCRAKLFHFDGKEWKERGAGAFKVNVTEPDSENSYRKARLIMRTDGVHRVVLNTPVFKGMKFGNNEGKEPTGKMLNLAGMENGKPVPLLLKTGSTELAKDLFHKIDELKQDL